MIQADFNKAVRLYVAERLSSGQPDVLFVEAWSHIKRRKRIRGVRWLPALKAFCDEPLTIPDRPGFVRVCRSSEVLKCPGGVASLTGYCGARFVVRKADA